MLLIDDVKICFILMFIGQTSGLSFNQPKFCPNVTWNPNAITFAGNDTVRSIPIDIFITTNNTIYVPNRSNNYIIVWSETSSIPIENISLISSSTQTVFITENNDVYFDYTWNSFAGIRKWTANSSNNISIMDTCPACYDIFVDISNNIYCSIVNQHQIIRKLLNNESEPVQIAAGTGIAGSAANMLNNPKGIFVDTDFDLYVVDGWNHRIQLFPKGQLNAVTLAGGGIAATTIYLNFPTGIVLDANKYLYIADFNNNRIVANGPYGFRCLFGCNASRGLAANQLSSPRSMSFDSFGNIFVVDSLNGRIQKFLLMTNSCNETIASSTNNVTYSSTNVSNVIAVNTTNGISYNQPNLDPYAVWNPSAITFANTSIVGSSPPDLFIDTNNTIYAANQQNGRIQVWTSGNMNPTTTIYTSSIRPQSIFVTTAGDIYTGSQNALNQVNKWTLYTNNSAVIMFADGYCYDLFVDINNILYCSVCSNNKVVAKSLTNTTNLLTIVAGTGCAASTSNTLNNPKGIFVDDNLNLYVADTFNNRVQLFPFGVFNGTTVAGNGSTPFTITLNNPTGVILDADKYVFITDYENNRIVGSGPNGFRCIVGCTGSSGSTLDALTHPISMAFDSYGNIYVVDQDNSRIQKFVLLNKTLVPSYNQPKFGSNATWNPNATTFENSSIMGGYSFALFIDKNNVIYRVNRDRGEVVIWMNSSTDPSIILYSNLLIPTSIFVTINGDIYVDNYHSVNQLDKLISYPNVSIPIMNINSSCKGLFVDITNTIYCSITDQHQVIKKWLNNNISMGTRIAGTGINGSASNMLCLPIGIFVDTNFDLYVADYYNDRIQLLHLGQSVGITVAGNTSPNSTISLNKPSNIILDGNKYIFITDTDSHRIVGSDQNGFHCIVGCSGSSGSKSDELFFPQRIAFDSFGNLFVADYSNNRTQKFFLLSNLSIDLYDTTVTPMTTYMLAEHTTSSTTTTSSMMNEIFDCYNPRVTLIPDGSTLLNPLKFLRSQEFTIISVIELNCNESLSFRFQWTIINCTASCLNSIQLDQNILSTFTEIFIPSRTLSYGIYKFEFNMTIIGSLKSTISRYAYVQIIRSYVIPNLLQLDTSLITIGHEQNLLLDPGQYSIDPDENTFNRTNWIYEYNCQIYNSQQFINFNGSSNLSCLSNCTGWILKNSSIIILANSLQSNQTYEFIVHITNRFDFSRQATDYVLIKVENGSFPMITIGCVISTMCIPNLEYQRINPTTQVALYSICNGNCTNIQNITWNIYYGLNNTMWTPFSYGNSWFFGRDTENLTVSNQLFLQNSFIEFWRFEVIYSFITVTSVSALNFVINQPPRNGSCLISPHNGTTSTLFTIFCSNWYDEDGIKDYSFYTWSTDLSKKTIIGYWPVSPFQLRLPPGDDQTSILNIIVYIRDQFECITECNLTSIIVRPDLINNSSKNVSHQIIQLLQVGNQNSIGQILTSISQQSNQINIQTIQQAVINGIPAASISISSLDSQQYPSTNNQWNQLAFNQFKQDVNFHANLREYLLSFTIQLPITTLNSILIQSSTLVHLTKATNQLTRLALTIVSNKCYQLTLALVSISSTISYEDVQMAATSLIQCATNVFTAVNGPLQQRTIVLDLDSSRGTAFPDDYDTDLESDWSKFHLIINGNLYYQKQTANQISNQVNEIISKLTSILNIHLNIGQKLIMNTSETFMSFETQSSTILSNLSSKQKISIKSMIQPLAPFGHSQSSANTNVSRAVSLSIADHYGHEVSIEANASHPIEIIIPRDPNLIVSSMILQNVTSFDSSPHYQFFYLHYVNITSSLSISVLIELHPLNSSLAYLLIYKFDQIPRLNYSINNIDGWTILCPSNDSIYTYFLDNQVTLNHQSLVFGLRELNSTEWNIYCLSSVVTSPPITNQRYNFTSNYELRIDTFGCYYLDKNNQWNEQGLRVGPLTNHNQTQCFSTHLTTFAGGFLVLPQPVNWQYVFANADFMRNKTIYLTVICIIVIYLLLIIYGRYQDRKDFEKLGIIPLSDNHSSDRYYYQILVFTGHRKESATKSQVQFVLAGDHHQTHIRTFNHTKRDIFQRGEIDGFLMSVPQCLGPLNYLHIWHDNSGKGSSASWFLKYLIVRDLQTMEVSYFISQRWFAVEKDDGRIERLLPVANDMEKNEFSYLLSKQTHYNVSDGHLWFSIFFRPPSNRFTRVQRCTCCFVLLYLSMFLNIMYYDLSAEIKTNNSLRLGPLIISREQIGIGIIVEALAFIPSLFLVQIFRRLRSHKQLSVQNDDDDTTKNKKKKFSLPWWFKYIAYGLCLILVGISIFFIIVRGIEFGDLKTQQWLTSVLTGFFSSVLLTQPLKILFLAIFFACICRKSQDDQQAQEYFTELDENEEYLHLRTQKRPSSIYQPITQSNRLTKYELIFARIQRLKEVHMWSLVHETFVYLGFLSLLFLLTYSHRTTNPCLQVQHLQNYFNDFNQISTIDEYWNWLEDSFVGNLRAQQWYNGDPPRNLSGYMNDKSNRLIGWAMMRQLRIKSNRCPYRKYNFTCEEEFSLSNQETNSFELGWTNMTLKIGNTTIEQAFQYRSADDLDSYTIVGDHGKYPGHGYVYEFRGRLADLQSNLSVFHQLGWIDSQTRAVIIQLSLYNPNVQLFTSVMLLAEFLSTGGLQTTIQIEPIDFYVSSTSIFQLICIFLYMMLIIYSIFIEIQSFFQLKRKYFHQFWPIIELGIIVCSWIGIALYIYRSKECSRIGQLFAETNGYVYINLQFLTYLNDFLTFMYGFCCFFGTMKFLRLCRYNSRICLFISTLRISTTDLFGFCLMFSIVFFAYVCLFYLLFFSKFWSASSVCQTVEMLFEMILLQFDANQLIDANAILGPFAFSLFVFVVVFLCLSMFITILNQSFHKAKENQEKNDEIYLFIWTRFLRWTGLKKQSKQERYEGYDAMMRTQYLDSFGLLEKRIDELLKALDRIYMEQNK